MERLTIPDVIIDKNTIRRTIIDASEVRKNAMKIYWRLKEIEDIISDDESEEYDLDRLRELAQADQEGKIPKYTIDDTIYDRFGDAWEVRTAELHLLGEKPDWMYRCGHAGTDDYRALWSFEILTSEEAQAALRREQDEKGGSSE